MRYLIYYLLFCFTFIASCKEQKQSPLKAEKGVLDLSHESWDKKTFDLKGEWAFFWKQFIPPGKEIPSTSYVSLPGYWNKEIFNGKKYPSKTFVSYRLKIILPDDKKIVSLKFPSVYSSYRLFANDRFILENGKVSESENGYSPSLKTRLVSINTKSNILVLTLHVSNYTYFNAGFLRTIQIGEVDSIYKQEFNDNFEALASISWLCIISIYHLGLYLLKRREKSFLFFVLFALSVIVSILLLWPSRIFFNLFPDSALILVHKIALALLPMELLTYSLFLYYLFHKDFHYPVLKYLQIFCFSLSLLILIFPIYYIEYLFLPFQILLIPLFAYTFFRISLSPRKRDSFFFLISIFIFGLTVLHDNLYFLNTSIFPYMISKYGLFLFLTFQSFILSLRFYQAIKKEEEFGIRLRKSKEELENSVKERTHELEEANILKSKFISIISHDLRSPLSGLHGIIALLMEDDTIEAEEQKSLLNMCMSSIQHSLGMIKKLLDLSRLQTGHLKLHYKLINLSEIIHDLIEESYPRAVLKNIQFISKIDEASRIFVDPDLFSEVIRNFLSNAIKFSIEGSLVEIAYSQTENNDLIMVSDSGTGIPEKMIPDLFNPIKKTSRLGTKGEEGTGLGLILCNDIIKAHGGEIRVQSEIGKGTVFTIYLPRDGKRVLLYDNQAKFKEKLKNYLISQQWLVIEADSAMEVLEIQKNMRIDAIILDKNADEISIHEMLFGLINQNCTVPVFLLSSRHSLTSQHVIIHSSLEYTELFREMPFDELYKLFIKKYTYHS